MEDESRGDVLRQQQTKTWFFNRLYWLVIEKLVLFNRKLLNEGTIGTTELEVLRCSRREKGRMTPKIASPLTSVPITVASLG